MNSKKLLLNFSITFVLIIVAFLIYSVIPRAIRYESIYGKELSKSGLLSQKSQQKISTFIKDSTSRMQVVMAVHNGEILFETGDTKQLINCHSARKSIMSLLYGIAIKKGYVKLDDTLDELGIDESQTPLTPQEKTATIRDLLMARSGVYLQAEAEVDYTKSNRPKRDQYKPGEHWLYNNFDFNVLGAILEKKTGMSIGEFLEENLAIPLEMQDFSASSVVYNSPWPVPNKSNSDYPVFWIFMSARDFAKIGVLIVQNGFWKDKEVVSTIWINKCLSDLTTFSGEMAKMNSPYNAFGYSWWINNENQTIWADGYGGQFLCINKANKLVVLQRNFTGNSLLSSGLFLMDKNRDNNPKSDLIDVYDLIAKEININ